ncbi:MAG UNVERIFIED_CONTAM: hypothetical protein LVR29_13735 [Microcystis novacekii LVE1205-3]|jgi:hypothetical protein
MDKLPNGEVQSFRFRETGRLGEKKRQTTTIFVQSLIMSNLSCILELAEYQWQALLEKEYTAVLIF